MPSIRQLKYAIKTIEVGSINEASKQLFISQPSLSNSLKDIEHKLGITIFERSAKGVRLSEDGKEFIVYARQIVEQMELMEAKYKQAPPPKLLLSVSCQHYAFAVQAFAELVQNYQQLEYKFTLRETETKNIISDVSQFNSELGILFLNEFNSKVLHNVFQEKQLEFTPLFDASPHVFISKHNPLAQQKQITLTELEPYPCLSFEQGDADSFYYAEEILSTRYTPKSITVSDRATIFNLMVGVNGYTISSGILSKKLDDEKIIAIPLAIDEVMTIGWIKNKNVLLSNLAKEYLQYLQEYAGALQNP